MCWLAPQLSKQLQNQLGTRGVRKTKTMAQSLLQTDLCLSEIARQKDVDALWDLLLDENRDELSRITAFRTLAALQSMSLGEANRIGTRSLRLKRVIVQFVAEQSGTKDRRHGPHDGGSILPTTAVEESAAPDWREKALQDESPSIQRLALFRD